MNRLVREIRFLAGALLSVYPWAALVVSLVLIVAVYQLPFRFDLPLGTPQAATYISNFYPQQSIEGRAARWSAAFSYIRLQGTGGNRPLRISIDLNPARPGVTDPKPPTVVLLVGGEQLYRRTLSPGSGWQTITLDVSDSHPAALAARDLVIELRTDVYRPPDYQGTEQGVAVSHVSVEPLPGAGWRPVVPNVRVVLLSLALLIGLYLLAARLWAGRNVVRPLNRRIAVVPLGASLLLAVGLAASLVGVAAVLQPLVVAVVAMYVLLVAGFYLVPALAPSLVAEARTINGALSYPWLLGVVLLAPVLFSIGFQPALSYTIDVGSGRDTPFIEGFNPPMFPMPDGSPGDYRYTSQRAVISVPGLGTDTAYSVTMRLNPGTGPALRGQVQIVANGSVAQNVRLKPGWQDISFRVNTGPPRLFEGSSLNIEIRSPAELVEGGEQRGIMVDTVQLQGAGGAGLFSQSPLDEAGLLLGVLLLYLLVARASGVAPRLHVKRLGLLCSLIVVLVVAWLLSAYRVELVLALPHLLLTLAGGYLLLVVSSRAFTGWPPVVHALFAAALVLRFGYSALPQLSVVDLPYHIGWLKRLIGGDFAALYFPGQLSSVPPEWNLDVLIPKSPLFYMVMWPLGLIQGIDLGPAVLFLVSLMDALLVPALYVLVRKVSPGAGLWAAGSYAFMPVVFRAFSYGILPTIFAQALTLFVVIVPTLWPGSLRRALPFTGWVLLLAASLIAFPTALAFNSFVVVLLAFGWWRRGAALPSTAMRLLTGLGLALVLSVVLYYGLYIGPFVSRTLPALAGGTTLRGKELWPGGPGEMVGWTGDYLVNWLPQLLIPTALLLVWGFRNRLSKRIAVLMLAWLVVLLLGMLLNLRFDMIGKHLYYTMPAAALAAGLILSRLWRMLPARSYSRALACMAALSIFWAALGFMASRL